jgi:hypothetical protein
MLRVARRTSMRGPSIRRTLLTLAVLCLTLAGSRMAAAQTGQGGQNAKDQDIYENAPSHDRFALGLGIGLVKPDGDAEVYSTASLRIRLRGRDHSSEPDERSGEDHPRYYRGQYEEGIRGYLEPEVGYWTGKQDNVDTKDALVGLNLVGVVPTRSADFFIGVGFGVHFVDEPKAVGNLFEKKSDQHLGGNLQVGVDINLSDSLALFGTGRVDILEGATNNRQSKVYGGLRIRF